MDFGLGLVDERNITGETEVDDKMTREMYTSIALSAHIPMRFRRLHRPVDRSATEVTPRNTCNMDVSFDLQFSSVPFPVNSTDAQVLDE